jgi:hypothetical protein
MADKIVMKISVDSAADPELFAYLVGIYPRRRAERMRLMALSGLGLSQPVPIAADRPEFKAGNRSVATHRDKALNDQDADHLLADIHSNF